MISDAVIDDVVANLRAEGVGEQTVMALRAKWPGLHFTYCMDDDIVATQPVRRADAFNIYLVDAHAHCLTMTDDPDAATGLVIAERLEGEDDGT